VAERPPGRSTGSSGAGGAAIAQALETRRAGSGDGLPGTVAAVDLGSNSFHLVVAQVEGERPRVVDRLSEMVRLAAGIDKRRRIAPEVQERALTCLRRFGERVKGLPPAAVRAVGTNTLRAAGPHNEFLPKAEEALGHPIEVISGVEEARLIYAGVAHSLEVSEGRRLVVDIGGGSTEVIVGQHMEPLYMESLHVGCVSVSLQHFPGGQITAEGMKKAELAARREFLPVAAICKNLGWQEAIGASGTFRAIDRVVRLAGLGPEGITSQVLAELARVLVQAGHVDRIKLQGMTPQRAPVFPGGVVIAKAALTALGVERVVITQGAMREGLIYDLIGRSGARDVRARTVDALAARYHVDGPHAARVEATARVLWAQAAGPWALSDPEWERLLAWGAHLHEIGRDIAHSQYHKHGAYVLANADLPGFSNQEQQRLAAMVRSHRRKFPVAFLRELGGARKGPLQHLAILLRLAVILHRARTADPVPPVALEPGKDSLALAFPDGWLEAHPLTRGDLEAEAAYLEAAGFLLTFR
jgi:exopolyphosphatase/guanosine-5'-triphosphate,3'-diphosphate pyrophosphatase